MDFVHDQLANGSKLRLLTVIDMFTREALAFEAGPKLRGGHVAGVLNRLVYLRGHPDNAIDNCDAVKYCVLHLHSLYVTLSLVLEESAMQSIAMQSGSQGLLGTVDFRQGMRKVAASVAVVATSSDGERRGITVTAVCSVSVVPPMIAVCVNKNSSVHDFIVSAGRFSVNMLGCGQTDIARAFAGGASASDRFNFGEWLDGPAGTPVLRGATIAFECALHEMVDAATHHIFVGSVRSIVSDADNDPLLYHDQKYKRAS